MKYKKYNFVLHFASGCLCAFLTGWCLWITPQLLGYLFDSLAQWNGLDYDHYMFIIIFLGVPVGSVLGVLLVDKLVLKSPEWNVRAMLLAFLFAFLGMGLLGLARYWAEGCEDGPIAFFIRGDRFILVILIVAGFLATLGHNMSFRYQKKI